MFQLLKNLPLDLPKYFFLKENQNIYNFYHGQQYLTAAYSAFMTARSNRRCPKAQLRVRMSEKYLQIGTPMTSLPRPVTSANFSRIESALSNPAISSVKFHDCYHNSSMTNLKDPVNKLLILIFVPI